MFAQTITNSTDARAGLLGDIADWFLSFTEDNQYDVEPTKPLVLPTNEAIVALTLEGAIVVPVYKGQNEWVDLDSPYGSTARTRDYADLDDTTLRWVCEQLGNEND